MGLSAGPGPPVYFACPKERRERNEARWLGESLARVHERHRVVLTGRTRPYRSPHGSALGVRSTTTAREYRCSCGHVGWSNHVDLEWLEERS